MLVGILAGGLGTRLSEYTDVRPKPMVEIGGKPLLWHLMKLYAHAGFGEFAIALGYRGEIVKDFFLNYRYRTSNLGITLGTGEVTVGDGSGDDWTVHLVDTGLDAQTGHELTAGNRSAVFAPVGFAHGFQTLEDGSEVLYLMSTPYLAEAARGLRWDDPAFGIAWPPTARRVMSERDRTYPDFDAEPTRAG